MKLTSLALISSVFLAPAVLVAQETEDRTLLSHEQMTAIINEVSGERAMHTILDMVPYQRVRPPEEYSGPYRESQIMADRARDYGFSNVSIEVFREGGTAWQPTQGELWMTTPKMVKLFDLHDIALSLASLNANCDISGELVDVGAGRAQDFEGLDVTGKFVLTSGSTRGAYTQAMQRGAIGALGVSVIGVDRASDYPDQIVSSSSSNAQPNTVSWNLTPAVRNRLAGLLLSGETVTIRSINKSVQVPNKAEYVRAEILGDGSTTQETAISAHLYEGVIKQGANDDNSGCALTLEIGRAYIKLIKEGKLPPPKRTINFLWVPEFSGTNSFLDTNPEKAENIIGDLNFDMEAIRISDSRSYWILQRTPDTFPSYINDIPQSMMEYVSDISRERVRFRRSGYRPSQPVESLRGSKDAFYIKIDKHYGASDHVAYMSRGIPAVMLITWPDMWYHSSEDTPDKQDSTQYKRAAAVGLGSIAVMSMGTDEMAARILNENLGRGLARMGESHTKGLGYMADATDAESMAEGYKEARNAIEHQAGVEKGVVRSASVLWTDTQAGERHTAAFEPLIDARAEALLAEVRAAYELQALQRGVQPIEPVPTAAELQAANLVVEQAPPAQRTAGRRGGGRRGGRRGGGRRGGGRPASLPGEFSAEFSILLRKNMTALGIRNFLSGEFTPLPLEDVMAVLRAREASGSIKLTPKGR